MKKHIKLILITILGLTLIGCGSNNKEKEIPVSEKVQTIINDAKSIGTNQIVEYRLIINDKEANTTQELSVYADLNEITYNETPARVIRKTSGIRRVNALGVILEENILSYEDITEEKTIEYTYNKEKNIWQTKINELVNIYNKDLFDFNELLSQLELAENIKFVNEKECYEYYAVLENDELKSFAESNNLDSIINIKAEMYVYINKNTYEPVQIIINFSNNDANIIVGELADSENMEYILDTYKIIFNYNGFNTVESLIIPEEAFNTFNDDNLVIKDLEND